MASPETAPARAAMARRNPFRRAAFTSYSTSLLDFATALLPVTLPGQSCLDTLFLSRFQVERMPLDFLDDVFLLHFSLETTEGVL
jgi:hypothetical protein